MRRFNEENTNTNNNNNNAFETINAAATVIASVGNRVPQAVSRQKRSWGGCWSLYWCFGYQRQRNRIGNADASPEALAPQNAAPLAENPIQAPAIVLPFVAPPSSPASFLQSEPPSAVQSPVGLLSISANMYSPGGPASIFAIGPYAHETQLVSPPMFSTFTTEPSTAPFTPPPESVHLTTPSSPEVPFAQLFGPGLQNGEGGQRFQLFNNEFPSYQLYPGSPVGHLISPSSGISGSGTSSPFPEGEFTAGGPSFLEFPMVNPPNLPNFDKLSSQDWGSCQDSGTLNPDGVRPISSRILMDCQLSNVGSQQHSGNGCQNSFSHSVSSGLTAKDESTKAASSFSHSASSGLTAKDESTKAASSSEALLESPKIGTVSMKEENSTELTCNIVSHIGETSNDKLEKARTTDVQVSPHHQKHHSITLGLVKEFNFDNDDGGDQHNSSLGLDLWVDGVVGNEQEATKNWSFFPMMQTSVS